jgi:hypothetical protein
MTDYSSLAVNDLRSFIWEQLKSNNILTESDYYADGFTQPIIPIIPSQQVPEFNNLLPGKTYLVYDNEMLPIEEQWWIIHEYMELMVISPNYDEINKVMNFMVDLLRRYDESATDVKKSNILSNNFFFHYTAIHRVKSPTPMKQEGGLRVGTVTILFCYSRKDNGQGRFS